MSDDEVNSLLGETKWDLYQSDLKVSKMIIKRPCPTLNFEIPVLPRPPRYRPGSGPPSQPVDLRLEDDSTAFIVDKVILPLEPFIELGDRRQRRAYYIIGWPDLPAARPVVDCSTALNYVAPYAIEQWEHKDLLRREAEKEQAEKEAALAAVAQAIAAEKGKVVGADSLPNGKKKPGRKPKNARLQNARPPTPQLNSEQEKLLAKRKQGPSLSTPQKRKSRIAQLEAEMEMEPLDHTDEDAGSDEEIRRQLESEALREVAMRPGEEEDDMDLLEAGTAASGSTSSSRASSVRPAPSDGMLMQRRRNSFSRVLRSPGISSLPSSRQQQRPSVPTVRSHLSQTHKPFSTTPIPLPQRPTIPSVPSYLSQSQKPVSTTPIPLPQRPGFESRSKVTSAPDRPSVVPSIETHTPSAQARARARATKLVTSALTSNKDVMQAPSSSSPSHTSNDNRGGFTPTNSFIPADGHFPRPPKRPADESPVSGDCNEGQGIPSGAKVKRERKMKVPKLAQPPIEPAADPSNEPQIEQEYVVKRLEDDIIVDGVQYFKVRWEGNWPPDQNPTWEPRENISAKLVKAYLKRKDEKAKNTPVTGNGGTSSSKGKSKEKHQSTLNQWASRLNYGSVSEAFEGQAELDHMNGKTHDDDSAEDDDELGGDAEEFLVVDKRKAEERERAAAARRKSLSSQAAAEFANVGSRRTSDF